MAFENNIMAERTNLVPPEIFVRPCVNGSSQTGAIFNFSLISECTDQHNCTGITKQPGAFFMSPIILSLAGITGQIGALFYLYRSNHRTNHKTVFYVMLATLIWTDLVGKLITTPQPIITYVMGYWIGGVTTCNIHGYSMSIIGLVTHLLVAVMALERVIGVRHGFFYNRVITTRRTRFTLAGIWIFTMIFCLGPFIGVGNFRLHYPGTWCHLNQHVCPDEPISGRIFHNLYSSLNLACLIVMMLSNLIVVGTLMKMRVSKHLPSGIYPQGPPRKKLKEREIQMVILLLIITMVFVFSWAPHDLLMFTNEVHPAPPYDNPMMDIRAIRLVSLNQIIDPWAYIISRMIFRSKLWKICRKTLFGKMISRSDSGKSERRSSILSVFSGSRKNSRACLSGAYSPTGVQDTDTGEIGKKAQKYIENKKISQVHFDVSPDTPLPPPPPPPPKETFIKSQPIKQKLQKVPMAFISLFTCTYHPNRNETDRNSYDIPDTCNSEEGYRKLIGSTIKNIDSILERPDSSLLGQHGRSHSWCGSRMSRLDAVYKTHSLETLARH